jgi:PmbA protein
MNYSKFFELAKEKGITECQLQVSKSESLSFRLFHHEIDSYSVNNSQNLIACGIYKGKFGSCRTQKCGKDSFDYLISGIIDSASTSEKDEGQNIFKGSEKYHKKNVFSKSLEETPVEKKIALLKEVENELFAYDKRISEVQDVEYEERSTSSEFYNSFGLKLKQKNNYFIIFGSVVAKVGEETKTGGEVRFGLDLDTFDKKDFVKTVAERALKKFGGVQCESGRYPTVLKNDVFADILNYFLSCASAEEIQKQSSFLIGKLNTKVASSKLTILEKPLEKNIFFSYFDDEGVATSNKEVVKNGVLKTYFYNQETAKKDGTVSTGNGSWEGNKIGISFSNIVVKPSKHSFDELIAPIKDGVYITEIAGLGTGMNAQSGNFSCQAEGYKIKDGKLAEPLNLITISGNLLTMLKDLKGFDNKNELLLSSINCADAYIKKLSIGGK